MSLIDKFASRWDFSKQNIITVTGSGNSLIPLIHHLDLSKSRLIRFLFMLRGLPKQMLSLKGSFEIGFILLEENNKEIVIGLVAQPWRLNGNIRVMSPPEFMQFNEPDFVKVAWNFYVERVDEKSIMLSTETRIACTSIKAKRRFSCYWLLIGAFSGLIRREMLLIIKDEVERFA